MKWILIAVLALHLFTAIKNACRLGWRAYTIGVLIGLDQFYNAILGGAPDETISSRCGRGQARWYWRILGRLLNWIQPGHIQAALAAEQARAHQSAALR